MKPTQLTAIRERAAAAPAEIRATAHTFGSPAVLIPCRTAHEAEAVAAFVRQARADIAALLTEIGEPIEPAQAMMELI